MNMELFWNNMFEYQPLKTEISQTMLDVAKQEFEYCLNCLPESWNVSMERRDGLKVRKFGFYIPVSEEYLHLKSDPTELARFAGRKGAEIINEAIAMLPAILRSEKLVIYLRRPIFEVIYSYTHGIGAIWFSVLIYTEKEDGSILEGEKYPLIEYVKEVI